MLAEKAQRLLCVKKTVSETVQEKIKYIDALEKRGLIENPIPQTAYKYPAYIQLNGKV